MAKFAGLVRILQFGTLFQILANAEGQVVETSYGKVQGNMRQSRNGRQYYQFLGIPYAKPPVGELRFEPPEKPYGWSGVREAIRFSEPCLQYEILFYGRVQGAEDCLYLNVFTHNIPGDEPGRGVLLPVMVYIHGGGFMSGSANVYKGKYFMDEDVVLVTLNYRLGSLGFLTTGDTVARGNNGLRDQNFALQWVQQNIANFGGDPSKVTIFGESVGGAAVHYHVLSKASTGLFQRAISQSGSALRTYELTKDIFGQAKNFAEKFDCPTEDSQELVDCLRKIDGRELVAKHENARGTIRDEYSLFVPVVERVKDGQEFLAENPVDLLQSGDYNKVPWLIGINSGEGLLYTIPIEYDRELIRTLGYPENWRKYLPILLGFGDQEIIEENAERIRREYFYTPIGSPSSFQNLTNMFSDKLFFLPSHRAAKIQSQHSPVYMYYFNFPTKFTLGKLAAATSEKSVVRPEVQIAMEVASSWFTQVLLGFKRPFYGSYHGDELHLLFDFNQIIEPRIGSPDYELSQQMVSVWTKFASQDSVNTTGVDVATNLKWKPIDSEEELPHYLELTLPMRIVKEPFAERLKFWKELLNVYE